MSASAPEGGKVQLYELRWSDGTSSIYVLGRRRRGLPVTDLGSFPSAGQPGLASRCPSGWALQYLFGGGGSTLPRFRRYGHIVGRAAPKVASIRVRYRDGSTILGTVANGYFFVWIKPSAQLTNVTLVAGNRAGQAVGRLVVGGYGGSPFTMTGKPWPGFACIK